MTQLTKEEVDAAAFWDSDVCLECPAIVNGEECPDCGEKTIPARTVMKVFDAVETNDD